jgi:hypothetical protein
MTQAINLANFSNSLDSSGGVPPTQLNAVVPVSKGGTNASTTANARTNLGLAIGSDVPSPTGTGASGTWSINVTGNAGTATNPQGGGSFITSSNIGSQSVSFATNSTNATNATNATNSTNATNVIGNGQSWQAVTRTAGVTYTNSTGKPIMLSIYISGVPGSFIRLTIDGVVGIAQTSTNQTGSLCATAIIPNGSTYIQSGNTATQAAYELR